MNPDDKKNACGQSKIFCLYHCKSPLKFMKRGLENPAMVQRPYSKNGTPGTAYFFNPSTLSSTPMPGLSETTKKSFFNKWLIICYDLFPFWLRIT